jgi:hypothetical protein
MDRTVFRERNELSCLSRLDTVFLRERSELYNVKHGEQYYLPIFNGEHNS